MSIRGIWLPLAVTLARPVAGVTTQLPKTSSLLTRPLTTARGSVITANGHHDPATASGHNAVMRTGALTMQYYDAPVIAQVCSTISTIGCFALRAGDEQVLGRADMEVPSNYVSRQQCVIQVAEDGSATLYSCGKAPTGHRSPGRDWQNVQNGEFRMLTDGDQLSLNTNYPESAVFTFQSEVAPAQGGYGQQGGYDQQYAQPVGYVRANYDMDGDPAQGQLSFRAGDVIEVLQHGDPDGWSEGSINGQVGWFPSNFCVPC